MTYTVGGVVGELLRCYGKTVIRVIHYRQGAVTQGLERAINSRVQQWHALLGQGPALSSGSGYQGWHLLVVPPNTRPSQVKGKA